MPGLTYSSTMNSSAIFEMIGVKEMGLNCFSVFLTGLCLRIGATSASFHDVGNDCSLYEQFIISVMGSESISASSETGWDTIRSVTLVGLKEINCLKTDCKGSSKSAGDIMDLKACW